MADNLIFTNLAIRRLKKLGVSEAEARDAFNSGQVEKASKGSGHWNAVKKYHGYEIGVHYDRKPDGQWVIISVWKRERR